MSERRIPQWWAWMVRHAPPSGSWLGDRPPGPVEGQPAFSQADLARVLDVSRSVVHSSVRSGATMEWVVRALAVLETRGWPTAHIDVDGGVMRVSVSMSAQGLTTGSGAG